MNADFGQNKMPRRKTHEMHIKCIVFLFMTFFMFSSCFKMKIESSALQDGLYLSSNTPKQFITIGEFKTSDKASWALIGLIKLRDADLTGVIRNMITKYNGNAVINLTIKTQETFSDRLIALLNLGLFYWPRTMFVTGTVVTVEENASLQPKQSAGLVYVEGINGGYYVIHGLINENTLITLNDKF